MPMKINILTSKDLPNLCEDDQNLVKVFEKHGIHSKLLIWDQDQVPKDEMVLIRTVWDYAQKKEDFTSLLSSLDKKLLLNPYETLKWNMDKSYLLELREKGASVVSTQIKHNFDPSSIENDEYPLVIKPLVGAGGINTFLLESYGKKDISVLEGTSVLIQPFIESVTAIGEYSFLYFNGKFSHAVLKTPMQGEFRVQDDHGGSVERYNPSKDELDEIHNILKFVDHDWTYARVDVVRNNQRFELMELELIEPELFFRFSDNGEEKLLQALKEKMK